jgi:hypothetical protein
MTIPVRAGAASRLRAKLEPVLTEVSARSQLIADHHDPRATYRSLVRLLHAEIRASVPLLRVSEREAAALAAHDPVAAGIVDWLGEHAVEELHHDQWLLDDYGVIGGDPDELVRQPGSPTIAAMVGSVYYWCLHAHPVAILGYCAVLEGSPPSTGFIDTLQARTEYPAVAFTTLRHHSDIDVDHSAELFALVDRLPLTAEHEALIGMTTLQTADLLIEAADQLLDAAAPTSAPQDRGAKLASI